MEWNWSHSTRRDLRPRRRKMRVFAGWQCEKCSTGCPAQDVESRRRRPAGRQPCSCAASHAARECYPRLAAQPVCGGASVPLPPWRRRDDVRNDGDVHKRAPRQLLALCGRRLHHKLKLASGPAGKGGALRLHTQVHRKVARPGPQLLRVLKLQRAGGVQAAVLA